LKAGSESEIDAAFASLVQLQAGAVLIGADALFFLQRSQLAALAARHAVPVISDAREFAAVGGLASYGASLKAVRQSKNRQGTWPDRPAVDPRPCRQGHRMNRRRFLASVGGAALAGPIAAQAQQPTGIPRIGLLMGANPTDEAAKLDAFREALEKLGYVDGRTILVELRYAMGQPDRFGSLARELVALGPSVIACVGRQETAALQAATRTIPIVFMQVHDPVEMGFVASLARPGGNTTGFTQMGAELDSKRLGLLHEIAPSLSRAAFLVNPNLTPGLQERFAALRRQPIALASC